MPPDFRHFLAVSNFPERLWFQRRFETAYKNSYCQSNRTVTIKAQEQIDATFPFIAELKANIASRVFPPERLDLATKHFIGLMEHLAVVAWQDLVVLRPIMSNNIIYTRSPFNDDAYGFLTYEAKLNEVMHAAPSAAAAAAETAARVRGDIQTADVLRSIIPIVADRSRNPIDGSPIRMIREIHLAVTDNADGNSGPPVPRQPLQFSLGPTLNIQDASTWPVVSPTGTLPAFATSFEFSHAQSLDELREEYLIGKLLSNGQRLPSVKQLELTYGPHVRTGSASTGFSYRSKRLNGSQRKDNDFSRRRPFYNVVDREGDSGFAQLLDQIKVAFPSESWKSTNWLLDELRVGRVGADPTAKKKSEAAKAGAATSTKRHRKDNFPLLPEVVGSPI
jgi:hypothetical protein